MSKISKMQSFRLNPEDDKNILRIMKKYSLTRKVDALRLALNFAAKRIFSEKEILS